MHPKMRILFDISLRRARLLGSLFTVVLLFVVLLLTCTEFSSAKIAYAEVAAQQTTPTAQPEEEPTPEDADSQDADSQDADSQDADSQETTLQPTFTGRWYTHIAVIDLEQAEGSVAGTVVSYDDNWNFEITGSIDGNILIVEPSDVLGEFVLTLSADGTELSGDPSDPLKWCGVRDGSLPDGCGYSGIWSIYSEKYTVPEDSYFRLTQTKGIVTGALVSFDEEVLQVIEGEIKWGTGYSLEITENDLLGTMIWLEDGSAFGTNSSGQGYELRINLAPQVSAFMATAYNPLPASVIDREDSPLVLPTPLYFLNSDAQIMRLDPAQFEAVQLTDEAKPVVSFDVARTHSGLVYVTNEQLVELDLISGERTVLVDGRSVPGTIEENEWAEQLRNLSQPRYSPDGEQIVYLHDGIWLVESLVTDLLADAEDPDIREEPQPKLVVANEWINEDYSNVEKIRLYNSVKWSPSGAYFLVSFGLWEGSASEIWDVAKQEALFDKLFWIPCCDANWGINDETVVAGSSTTAYGQPGLFQLDIEQAELTTLLDGNPNQSQLALLASGAHQSQSGDIFTLLSQAKIYQSDGKIGQYALHQVTETGKATLSNPSGVSLPKELLWAEDDSGLLVADQDNVLQWLPVDGETITSLFIIGTNLRWGSANSDLDEAVAELPTREFPTLEFPSRSLQKQAAIDFGPEAEESNDDSSEDELSSTEQMNDQMISARYLTRPTNFVNSSNSEIEGPIWVAYSTTINENHWVAFYMQDGNDWQLLEKLQFPAKLDGEQLGPSYVGDGSVQPEKLSDDRYWLSLIGGAGVGMRGTFYYLLSFDGETLAVEAEGTSNGGSGGWLEDIDFNGTTDYFVANESDYAFCSFCGMQRVQYSLSRWDGAEMVPVELTLLDDENMSAEVTAEMRELNNEAVQLARAGLWKDVQERLSAYNELTQTEASQEDPPQRIAILDDNMAFLRIHLRDIQQEVYNADSVSPLLANIFFGDYSAALDLVRPLPQDDVFNQESPLLYQAATAGWGEPFAESILTSTEVALDSAPERAEIHFFNGWANWLLGDSEAATAALTTAVDLAPTEQTYRAARTILQPNTESLISLSDPSLAAQRNMNLRVGPGTQYERAASMPAGTSASILGKSVDGEWWLIWHEASSKQLWVSANPVYTTATDADSVPIIEPDDLR